MAEQKAGKSISKTEFLRSVAASTGLTRDQVNSVLEEVRKLVAENLAESGPGVISVPGLAKIRVVRKPAVPEREGINPFTKEPTVFKAKPAKNVVKIQALKALKDSV